MENPGLTHSFKVDEASVARFKQMEDSIAHFSVQLGKAALQMDEMKSGLHSLYSARQQLMTKVVEQAGVTAGRVLSMDMNEDGTVTLLLSPEPPSTEAPSA